MAVPEVGAVSVYRKHIDLLLERAEKAKPDKQIEPPLSETHLGEAPWVVQKEDQPVISNLNQQTQFAAVEIAFREKFYSLLVRSFPPEATCYKSLTIALSRLLRPSKSLHLFRYGTCSI